MLFLQPCDFASDAACSKDRSSLLSTVQSFLLTNARIVDYPIVYCNEGFAKMTGYSRMDIMQKSGNCSHLYGDHTTQEMKDRLVQALDNQNKEQLEILLYKKNRTLKITLVNLSSSDIINSKISEV